MTLTAAVRLLDDNLLSNQIEADVISNFLDYLDGYNDVILRVCMHETDANASSVYFEGFRGGAAGNLQFADDAALLCVEETNVFRMFKKAPMCTVQRGRLHAAFCYLQLEGISLPVLKLSGPAFEAESSLVALHIGRVYRMTHTLSVRQHNYDPSGDEFTQDNVFRLTSAADFMIRNRKHFIYIIQHDVFCSASHLRHKDAEVLVYAWKHACCCTANPTCAFFPNSTQNEGRNAAWYDTFVKWPGTVFTYYVFVDGDMSLTFRPERSSLPAVDGLGSEELPFRMFEQHMLHYSPAVGFPYYSGWHHDNGEEVQFVSNYDHIMIAIHHNVSRLFLPTETRFDDVSWWYGQRIHGFLASVAFGNQTLQLNAVVSDNGSTGKRFSQLNGIKAYACTEESPGACSCRAIDAEVAAASKICASALFRCVG